MSKAVALEQPGSGSDSRFPLAVAVPTGCFQYILRLIAVGLNDVVLRRYIYSSNICDTRIT